MSHWIWKNDMSSEHQASLGTRPALIRDHGLRFDEGILVAHPALGAPVDIALSGDDDGLLTDNLVSPGLPALLVSSRLRAAFEEGGADNIQYFPVNLTTTSKPSPHPYFIANIIGRVMCIDQDRSDIVMDAGPPVIVDAIDHLALHKERIQDMNIFRLGELPVVIVVSSRLKDVIERLGITGVGFYPVDDFVF